jgi:hypothetical protein
VGPWLAGVTGSSNCEKSFVGKNPGPGVTAISSTRYSLAHYHSFDFNQQFTSADLTLNNQTPWQKTQVVAHGLLHCMGVLLIAQVNF